MTAFGVETTWDRFYEAHGSGWDRLDLAEGDLVIRTPIGKGSCLRGGLGARALHDAHGKIGRAHV